MSYVLLFEFIVKSKLRSIYCGLFTASLFMCNIIMATVATYINGELLNSILHVF